MLPLKPIPDKRFSFEKISFDDFEIDRFLSLSLSRLDITDQITVEEIEVAFHKVLERIRTEESGVTK